MGSKIKILIAGVGHERFSPKKNKFFYNVFYLDIPVDKNLDYKKPLLFSFNRWNVFSVNFKDHGNKENLESLYVWSQKIFNLNGITIKDTDKIRLISHPRIFGYAFNPISYWLLLDIENNLISVICEVNNTFGDNHSYIIFNKDFSEILPNDIFIAKKDLYVSPFTKTDAYYKFKFTYKNNTFKSVIDLYENENITLNTFMGGDIKDLNNLIIIKSVFIYPFMTLLVVLRIHFQAVKLYFKKVPLTLRTRDKKYTSGRFTKSN